MAGSYDSRVNGTESKKFAVRPEERMRAVERTDRHAVGHDMAEPLVGKPNVKMKRWTCKVLPRDGFLNPIRSKQMRLTLKI